MVRVISEETFDSVVSDILNDFGMDREEAVNEAKAQLNHIRRIHFSTWIVLHQTVQHYSHMRSDLAHHYFFLLVQQVPLDWADEPTLNDRFS